MIMCIDTQRSITRPCPKICTPPPLCFAPILMKDAQCAESNENKKFPIYIFSSYRENSSKIDKNEHKLIITKKIKIWNMIFLSIQHIILHLSCKFYHFWIFFIWKTLKRLLRNMPLTLTCSRLGTTNPKKKSSSWIFFLHIFVVEIF